MKRKSKRALHKKALKLIDFYSAKVQRKYKKIPVAKAEKVVVKIDRAVKRVNEEAYVFAPDTMLAVGLDYKNQRILVKVVEGDEAPPAYLAALATATKKQLVIGRMERGWGLGRDCLHPRQRIQYKQYCVGSDKAVVCFRRAKFCTACGTILSKVPEASVTKLQEIVNVSAAYPQVRKVKP